MKRTLFRRVFPAYLAAVTIGLALLGVVATTGLSRDARQRDLQELAATARYAALRLRDAEESQRHLITDFLSNGPVADWFAIVDQSGSPISATGPQFRLPRDVALEATDGFLSTGSLVDDADRRIGFAVAYVDASSWLLIARTQDDISVDAQNAFGGVLLTAGLLVIAIGILLYRLLKWIDEPIVAIQGAARYLAQGQLDIRVRASGPPELRALASDLDHMADQLRLRISAISRQRNQLEAILSSMLEGVVLLNDERSIITMNDAAGRLLQVPADEAHGRTLIEFLRNAQLDELAELTLSERRPIERTITLYRDRPVHLQVHATPLHGESAPSGSLLVMNDISRLVQLETLRKDFVANVSHELKTPITSIKGFIETLIEDSDAGLEQRNRYLAIILSHTDRLNAIIEDLLSLSRLEQSDQRITFREFDLNSLLASALSACERRAVSKQIEVKTNLTGEPTAWGNPNLLEQALVNLLDNSLKYSSDGDAVDVTVENTADRLLIAVRDRGQGIPAVDLPRIFERFYRTDRARSRELGGTGLGLAIVKHIARAHRGTVDVESVYGEGSTFTIEIPR